MKFNDLIKLSFILLTCCYVLLGCNSHEPNESVNAEKPNDEIPNINTSDKPDYLIGIPYDKSIEYKTNLSSNIANGNYVVHDEYFIYYINNSDGKIYKINHDGQNREVLYDSSAERLFLYNDEIYFIKTNIVGKLKISNEICSIDKSGNNLKIVLEADDILNFNIYNDIIYYNASSNVNSDGIIPYKIHNLFKYNLNTNEKSIIYEDISCNVMGVGIHQIIIENDKIYFDAFVDEYIKMMEYDIKNNTVRCILDNQATIINDNNMFFYTVYDKEKNLNKLCKLSINEDIANAKDIFFAKDNINMQRIALNEKYIFLMYNEYSLTGDVKLNILRIKHDGSEVIKIVEYDSEATSSYFYGYMQLVNDKLIVYDYNFKKNPEYSITVMDFDGNLLDWDM